MLFQDLLYVEDVKNISELDLPWEKFKGRNILISGATGLVGCFLIDVIMEKNISSGLNCKIFALGRDKNKAQERFGSYKDNLLFSFIAHDINKPLVLDDYCDIDYVIHMASNTHPLLYANDPIGTISTNIIGLMNLLEFAVEHNTTCFAFTSSNEIYGENRGDVELFEEDYCGYIDCNTLRAGYPESKRCGEALCQAYKTQKGLKVVIPRVTRTYGPTMQMNDSKAISQFIKNSLNKEPIVLKSNGTQYYSYMYVADAVSGLLYILLKGKNGEAYNISDVTSDITLRELANLIANISGTEVTYKEAELVELSGFSKATKARLNGNKLRELGWLPKYNIEDGIKRTISILSKLDDTNIC